MRCQVCARERRGGMRMSVARGHVAPRTWICVLGCAGDRRRQSRPVRAAASEGPSAVCVCATFRNSRYSVSLSAGCQIHTITTNTVHSCKVITLCMYRRSLSLSSGHERRKHDARDGSCILTVRETLTTCDSASPTGRQPATRGCGTEAETEAPVHAPVVQ